jgi:branched-chain amino acid transport system permease protein
MDYLFHLIVIISLYVALTATLDLLIGHTGILSFAHAALYGVGAYTTAILTVYANWHWLPALAVAFLIGTAVAALVGIPTLRLGGDYFILALFGFQLIVNTVILNWEDLTNGPFGIRGIPRPSFGTGPISSGWPIASFTLAAVAIIVFLVWRLVSAPLKLVLHAIRDDETVAQALGIDVVRTRIVIFALAGGLAAVVGSLLAFYARFIDVSSFSIETMILLWAMAYVGGVRTITGAIVGPAILVLFPEIFRFIDSIGVDRSQLQEALYGLLMVLLMLYRPQGVMGGRRNIVAVPV